MTTATEKKLMQIRSRLLAERQLADDVAVLRAARETGDPLLIAEAARLARAASAKFAADTKHRAPVRTRE